MDGVCRFTTTVHDKLDSLVLKTIKGMFQSCTLMYNQAITIDQIKGRKNTGASPQATEFNEANEFLLDDRLRVSEFLRVIDQGENVLLYHTLF
jgi:hypothetical protein